MLASFKSLVMYFWIGFNRNLSQEKSGNFFQLICGNPELVVVFASLFKIFTTLGLSLEESIDKANYEMTIDPNNDLNKVDPSEVIYFFVYNCYFKHVYIF